MERLYAVCFQLITLWKNKTIEQLKEHWLPKNWDKVRKNAYVESRSFSGSKNMFSGNDGKYLAKFKEFYNISSILIHQVYQIYYFNSKFY